MCFLGVELYNNLCTQTPEQDYSDPILMVGYETALPKRGYCRWRNAELDYMYESCPNCGQYNAPQLGAFFPQLKSIKL